MSAEYKAAVKAQTNQIRPYLGEIERAHYDQKIVNLN